MQLISTMHFFLGLNARAAEKMAYSAGLFQTNVWYVVSVIIKNINRISNFSTYPKSIFITTF